MALEEIFPFVYGIGMGYVNAFLIAEEDGLTLIDSGLRGRKKTLLGAVRKLGRRREELKHVLITHHHVDHTGSLAAVKAATGATAYVHPLDIPVVTGEKPVPGPNPASILGKIAGPLIARLPYSQLEPSTVEHQLADGEELPMAGGMKVIHTPGHTLGHVSFLMPGHGGVLFAGDAAGHLLGRLGKPSLMFTEDMDQARQSMRKLAALEFDSACFGHGSVLKGQANVAFRRYVEKMAR